VTLKSSFYQIYREYSEEKDKKKNLNVSLVYVAVPIIPAIPPVKMFTEILNNMLMSIVKFINLLL